MILNRFYNSKDKTDNIPQCVYWLSLNKQRKGLEIFLSWRTWSVDMSTVQLIYLSYTIMKSCCCNAKKFSVFYFIKIFYTVFKTNQFVRLTNLLRWWWWWIVLVVWLTDGRCLALFPAGTILRDPHHRESPTRRIWTCAEPEFRIS